MFEKDLSYAEKLDVYGNVLSERRREVLTYYYDDDLSLSEIAEVMGSISRQGVRDAIKRGEAELDRLEELLGLAKSARTLSMLTEKTDSLIRRCDGLSREEIKAELMAISEALHALSDE
ncbi:MAG: DNA-binding protein [Firmicutes bacterium]|nr:DNA-binding protein [Bacillota bacterium]